MKRSSPTDPCPFGGPPKRGCFYMGRFFFVGLVVLWLALLFLLPFKNPGPKLGILVWATVAYLVVFVAPMLNLAERLEIRRYCESRGFQILKFRWRGVVYMDGTAKRYSRWPEDFQVNNQG